LLAITWSKVFGDFTTAGGDAVTSAIPVTKTEREKTLLVVSKVLSIQG